MNSPIKIWLSAFRVRMSSILHSEALSATINYADIWLMWSSRTTHWPVEGSKWKKDIEAVWLRVHKKRTSTVTIKLAILLASHSCIHIIQDEK